MPGDHLLGLPSKLCIGEFSGLCGGEILMGDGIGGSSSKFTNSISCGSVFFIELKTLELLLDCRGFAFSPIVTLLLFLVLPPALILPYFLFFVSSIEVISSSFC